MVSKCPKCGSATDPGDLFCGECGAPLAAATVDERDAVDAGPERAQPPGDSSDASLATTESAQALPGGLLFDQNGAPTALTAIALAVISFVALYMFVIIKYGISEEYSVSVGELFYIAFFVFLFGYIPYTGIALLVSKLFENRNIAAKIDPYVLALLALLIPVLIFMIVADLMTTSYGYFFLQFLIFIAPVLVVIPFYYLLKAVASRT